ncbi:hypothetical protein CTEN210_18676 [Chaetoceros tenuissimus]|uniref:Integrase catalytic domain-containing protein n=1 Tax=Chaetoceros tenuissimus TaxID=426638 RepID=A0AAD3DFQ9_9STRA|nr:hypothetical protein CTEN210_18676 [Chaetoceros tenuissimus]
MDDSLVNPIQAEESDVRVDVRPKRYYLDPHAQTITFPCGTVIPVDHDGALPFIPFHRPTADEIHSCQKLVMSAKFPWDPSIPGGNFSQQRSVFSTSSCIIDSAKDDPVASSLMSHLLSLCNQLLTTGALSPHFKTDKAQLQYKQLSRIFGKFYCDYLKVKATSIQEYKRGVIYTNGLGFYKFLPCENETFETTEGTLRYFLHVIGLPYSLHSDNHGNFKDGLFKRLIRKFGIYQTFTEPHSPWQNRAEPVISGVKRYAQKIMMATCFCYEYTADLLSLLVTRRGPSVETTYEMIMHYTPDISEYVSFAWFQWCYYFNKDSKSMKLSGNIQNAFLSAPTEKKIFIGPPDRYLGVDNRKVNDDGANPFWTMSSNSYLDKAIKNLKAKLKESGLDYNKKLSDPNYSLKQPFTTASYQPELDTSEECTDDQVTLFKNLIGILQWAVELDFDYDKVNEQTEFMKKAYPDDVEDLPPNAPVPRRKLLSMYVFVDSDYAGEKVTSRSQTEILLYLNSSPIIWYSKRQATIESSTFGSEFVALHVASELIISMRYKLRMIGVPIEGP